MSQLRCQQCRRALTETQSRAWNKKANRHAKLGRWEPKRFCSVECNAASRRSPPHFVKDRGEP